jgi:hypothetical protein
VRGPLINGGFSQSAFGGQSTAGGLGAPSPSSVTVLRQAGASRQIPIRVDLNQAFRDPRERIRILPGDIVVLQETPEEAFARYVTNIFNLSFTVPVIRAGDLQGTGGFHFP